MDTADVSSLLEMRHKLDVAQFAFEFDGLRILVVSHVVVDRFDIEELLVAALDHRCLFMHLEVVDP